MDYEFLYEIEKMKNSILSKDIWFLLDKLYEEDIHITLKEKELIEIIKKITDYNKYKKNIKGE